jgi:hypothetical protein
MHASTTDRNKRLDVGPELGEVLRPRILRVDVEADHAVPQHAPSTVSGQFRARGPRCVVLTRQIEPCKPGQAIGGGSRFGRPLPLVAAYETLALHSRIAAKYNAGVAFVVAWCSGRGAALTYHGRWCACRA